MMNLYLVKRTDRIGWDEYESFVCTARDADEARHTDPDFGCFTPAQNYFENRSYWVKVEDLNTLEVYKIGFSFSYSDRMIITSSYNAG